MKRTVRSSAVAGALRILPLQILLLQGVGAAQGSRVDSLEIESLRLQLRAAAVAVQETDLLHALMPRVTLTASFGVRDMLFIDPANGQTSFLPRDAYRLTLALSLSDLLDTGRHERALLERNLKMLDLESEKARQAQRRDELIKRAESLRTELASLTDQSNLYRRIERYYSILFEEGKVQFDALAGSRLRTLEISLRIARIRAELQHISEN